MRGRDIRAPENSDFVPFTPETRMSGIDYGTNKVRKGAADSVEEFAKSHGCTIPADVKRNS